MNDRLPNLALLLITLAMLLMCLAGLALLPAKRAAIQSTDPMTYRIDPNEADEATLCLLPRIGPGIAQRLIDDRQANGQFQTASDLTRVSMIGDKTVAALRPWIDITAQD